MNNITIGQYYPGHSVIHRLDGRVKILLLILIITALFLIDGLIPYAIFTAAALAVCFASDIPFAIVLKSLKPLLWIVLLTLLVHLISTPGTETGRVWIFTVTREGLERGILVALRLSLIIVLSSLLTLTTTPLVLTDAIESILQPLKKIGVPAHELAMMMTIALRFVPTLLEETDKIVKAQKSRGADFDSGFYISRLKNLVPILIPLFISAFRRADDLAIAMESRCYCGGEGRTHLKKLALTNLDYWAVVLTIVFIAVLVAFNFQFRNLNIL